MSMIDLNSGVHIMLDLETFGTTPGSAIASIGAVKFNADAGYARFVTYIDPKSSESVGLTIEGNTFLWWLGQNEAARRALIDAKRVPIEVALTTFSSWALSNARSKNEVFVWGKGADFDNVILDAAYRYAGLERPWGKYNSRCYRTVSAMYPHVPMDKRGTAHNALDDAMNQARHLVHIYRDAMGIPINPRVDPAPAAVS